MDEQELAVFYDKLSAHDWYYTFSDHGATYRKGEASENNLVREAGTNGFKQALYDAYKEHIWSGPHVGKPEVPKPARPTGPVDTIEYISMDRNELKFSRGVIDFHAKFNPIESLPKDFITWGK
jgi:hypothetical protein